TPAPAPAPSESPTRGAPGAAGFGPLPRLESMDADWWAFVAHDHVGGAFDQFCVGVVFMKGEMVGFTTPSGAHDWAVPASQVREAKKNLFTGAQFNAFHITLRSGGNYNFAVLDENGRPILPDTVLGLLGRVLPRD
ncbi:MAG: hypothetical protein AB1635_19010, partial [Acidobacteriota bacterium]